MLFRSDAGLDEELAALLQRHQRVLRRDALAVGDQGAVLPRPDLAVPRLEALEHVVQLPRPARLREELGAEADQAARRHEVLEPHPAGAVVDHLLHPALAQGKVYLTTAVPKDGGLSLRALAVDGGTGKIIWDREVRAVDKAPKIHSKNSHASPTPIVRDGSVFVHFGALGMASLAAADGAIQWTNFDINYPPVHGSGGSPVLHDGKLVIVCDGSTNPFVAAIDAKTGKLAWKQPRSILGKINHSFVTPTVTVIDGKAQVMAPGPDHFAAYDLETGVEVWRVKAPGWSVVPQPAIGHGLVIYNHDYDNPELLAVKLGGKGDVTESNIVWRLKQGAPSSPSPLLVGDEL